MISSVSNFTFLVLMHNHGSFILEHLESVRYLVVHYGEGIDIRLIVNDDCSIDETVKIVDKWIENNTSLFSRVVKIYNKTNVGTCKSICNMIRHLTTDYCKMTGGDDVYSYENIFDLARLLDSSDIASGIPLSLVDGVISKNRFDIYNIIISSIIYNNEALIERFKWISLNNAPNIIYRAEHLRNENILKFVSEFDVVEDLPLQIAIAENNKRSIFFLDKKVYVYYRRTPGSTYLVESERFNKDQTKIFKYLIDNETSVFSRLILNNRLFCFASGKRFVKRFMNLSVYFYLLACIRNLLSIFKNISLFNDHIDLHSRHYLTIKEAAHIFETNSLHLND